MKRILSTLLLVMLCAACAPSEQAIQTAIAETQQAKPASTPIPPTITPSPTFTLTLSPTPTFTITTSPTPDLRVINIDPKEFLLALDDLPPEGKYFLPKGWITPHRNSEMLQQEGVEKGQDYVSETERVDGWVVRYKRGDKNVPMPSVVYDNVIMYQTSEGARLLITKWNDILDEDWTEVDTQTSIGDISKAYTLKKNGYLNYEICFSYRNYAHCLIGYDKEDAHPEFIEKIALLLLDDLKSAPLSQP